ncbi:hypothetical protein H2204_012370 [Knufia peltigerae]|uniref:Pentatricopeptide repeat-containing protein n=1 Tax=Knufia peltigerae TaxID=1002370 RepID=A0AA38XTS0_9EURO|nr:hypothetical protein H2204_012370 [Knufia peltigerae]
MFTCSACLLWAFRSLTVDLTTTPSCSLRTTAIFRRNHATLQSIQQGHHRRLLTKTLRTEKRIKGPSWRGEPAVARASSRDAEARKNNRLRLMNNHGRTEVQQNARRELQYLSDPLKLAQTVADKLRDSKFDAALNLVRESDKGVGVSRVNIDNTVSWNHLINWLMQQRRPKDAWKIYNEMKKRGHKPDAHTYTIMLRGYRENYKQPGVVEDAIKVYNSIGAANSAVKPTIIHTNAVLNVCARALFIDSMWVIAGKLPEQGPGAPDHITFTTIMNTIHSEVRHRAVKLGASSPDREYDPQPIFEEAVNDARNLWTDIVSRWRRGLLQLDEQLVCAMGRILLLSSEPKAYEDVLNLVQQTMSIPRFAGDLTPEKETEDRRMLTAGATDESEEVAPSSTDITLRTVQSMPIANIDSSIYAAAGKNTLSMLLEATTALRQIGAGKYYWQLLTSPKGPYKLEADRANIISYMRLLRVSRASQATLDLLLQPRPADVQQQLMSRGTFIIAMSTCYRDKKNPNVFSIANRIIKLMEDSVEAKASEDENQGIWLKFAPSVLEKYLQLAMATTKGLDGEALTKTKEGDLDFERDPSKNNTFVALEKLKPEVTNVMRLIKSHVTELERLQDVKARTKSVQTLLDKRRITPYSVMESVGPMVDFLRTVIGAYDKILRVNERLEDDGMGPLDSSIIEECWSKKRRLAAFLGKVESMVDQSPPGEKTTRPASRTAAWEDEEDGNEGDDGAGNRRLDDHYGQRARTLKSIKAVRSKVEKKREERNLSRIQKRELVKEERIRAQFPKSVLRPNQDQGPPRKKKFELKGSNKEKKDYDGWGRGFQDLAKRSGRGGFVDLER